MVKVAEEKYFDPKKGLAKGLLSILDKAQKLDSGMKYIVFTLINKTPHPAYPKEEIITSNYNYRITIPIETRNNVPNLKEFGISDIEKLHYFKSAKKSKWSDSLEIDGVLVMEYQGSNKELYVQISPLKQGMESEDEFEEVFPKIKEYTNEIYKYLKEQNLIKKFK